MPFTVILLLPLLHSYYQFFKLMFLYLAIYEIFKANMLDKPSTPAEQTATNMTLPGDKSIVVLRAFGYGSAFPRSLFSNHSMTLHRSSVFPRRNNDNMVQWKLKLKAIQTTDQRKEILSKEEIVFLLKRPSCFHRRIDNCEIHFRTGEKLFVSFISKGLVFYLLLFCFVLYTPPYLIPTGKSI